MGRGGVGWHHKVGETLVGENSKLTAEQTLIFPPSPSRKDKEKPACLVGLGGEGGRERRGGRERKKEGKKKRHLWYPRFLRGQCRAAALSPCSSDVKKMDVSRVLSEIFTQVHCVSM